MSIQRLNLLFITLTLQSSSSFTQLSLYFCKQTAGQTYSPSLMPIILGTGQAYTIFHTFDIDSLENFAVGGESSDPQFVKSLVHLPFVTLLSNTAQFVWIKGFYASLEIQRATAVKFSLDQSLIYVSFNFPDQSFFPRIVVMQASDGSVLNNYRINSASTYKGSISTQMLLEIKPRVLFFSIRSSSTTEFLTLMKLNLNSPVSFSSFVSSTQGIKGETFFIQNKVGSSSELLLANYIKDSTYSSYAFCALSVIDANLFPQPNLVNFGALIFQYQPKAIQQVHGSPNITVWMLAESLNSASDNLMLSLYTLAPDNTVSLTSAWKITNSYYALDIYAEDDQTAHMVTVQKQNAPQSFQYIQFQVDPLVIIAKQFSNFATSSNTFPFAKFYGKEMNFYIAGTVQRVTDVESIQFSQQNAILINMNPRKSRINLIDLASQSTPYPQVTKIAEVVRLYNVTGAIVTNSSNATDLTLIIYTGSLSQILPQITPTKVFVGVSQYVAYYNCLQIITYTFSGFSCNWIDCIFSNFKVSDLPSFAAFESDTQVFQFQLSNQTAAQVYNIQISADIESYQVNASLQVQIIPLPRGTVCKQINTLASTTTTTLTITTTTTSPTTSPTTTPSPTKANTITKTTTTSSTTKNPSPTPSIITSSDQQVAISDKKPAKKQRSIPIYNQGPPFFKVEPADVFVKVGQNLSFSLPDISDPDNDKTEIYIDFNEAVVLVSGQYPNFTASPQYEDQVGMYVVEVVLKDIRIDYQTSFYRFSINVQSPELKVPIEKNETTIESNNTSNFNPFVNGMLKAKLDKLVEERKIILNETSEELTASIDSVSSTGLIIITFNQEIIVPYGYQDFNDSVIEITLLEYQYTTNTRRILEVSENLSQDDQHNKKNLKWRITSFSPQQIKVQIEFNHPLEISQITKDTIQVKFVMNGFFIQKRSLKPIKYQYKADTKIPKQLRNDAMSNALTEKADLAGKLLLSFMLGSYFVNIALAATLQFLWGMLNVLQIIFHIPLICFNSPQNVVFLYSVLIEIANFQIIPIQSLQDKLFNFTLEDSPDYLIDNLQITFYNLIFIVAATLSVFALRFVQKFKAKIIFTIYKYLEKTLLFNFILRFLIESYLLFCSSVGLSIRKPSTNKTSDWISMVFSYILAIFIVVFPIASFTLLIRNQKILPEKRIQEKYGALYEELNYESRHALSSIFMFCFRRVLMLLIAIVLINYPCQQIQIFFIMSLFMTIYIISIQPFNTKTMNRIEIFNELTILSISYCLLLITDFYPSYEGQYNVGWGILIITLFNILVNMLSIFFFSAIQLYRKIKGLCSYIQQKLRQEKLRKYNTIERPMFISHHLEKAVDIRNSILLDITADGLLNHKKKQSEERQCKNDRQLNLYPSQQKVSFNDIKCKNQQSTYHNEPINCLSLVSQVKYQDQHVSVSDYNEGDNSAQQYSDMGSQRIGKLMQNQFEDIKNNISPTKVRQWRQDKPSSLSQPRHQKTFKNYVAEQHQKQPEKRDTQKKEDYALEEDIDQTLRNY